MGNLLGYSGLTTKLKAMRAKLLTDEDYARISEFENAAELIRLLKASPGYAELFADVDEQDFTRRDVENRLEASFIRDFAKIYRFADQKQREFLKIYFRTFEIRFLKRSFRLAFDERSHIPNPRVYPDFFRAHSKLDIDRLSDAWTAPAVVDALYGTDYYKPFAKLKDRPEASLFDYEMALDMYNFVKTWKDLEKNLSGDDLDELKTAYGSRFDMINLNWIYRSKRFYGQSPEDTIALLIPVRYKLNRDQIKKLVYAENDSQFSEVLNTTWYARKFGPLAPEELEDTYVKVMRTVLDKESKRDPYSAAMTYSYLYKKKHEVGRLTTALECLRYGMESGDTLKYVLRQ